MAGESKIMIVFILSMIFMSINAKASEYWYVGEEYESEGYRVTPVDDSGIALLKYLEDETNVIVPAVIHGYEVREIRSDAFFDKKMSSIYIPDTVRQIQNNPWLDCNELASVTVSPGNLFYESIDNTIYSKKDRELVCCPVPHETLVIPSGITSIGDRACYWTRINDVVFPDSVQYIGKHAFAGTGISYLDIPAEVRFIESGAFEDCYGLKTIRLPDSLKSIESKTFSGCIEVGYVRIPASVQSIGETAFECITGMTCIVDPGSYAESYCFENDIEFQYDDGDDTVANGTLGDSANWSLGWDGTIHIYGTGELACQYENLNRVIPGDFELCRRIVIENGITSIPDEMFSGLWQLEEVILGDSIKSIGEYAFKGCQELRHITIPAGVETVGEGAFDGCPNLETVYKGEHDL